MYDKIHYNKKKKIKKLQVTRKSSPSIWLMIQTVFGTKGSISNELSSKPDVAGPGIRQQGGRHILYTCMCHSSTSIYCGMMTFSPGEDVIAALLFVETAFLRKL